MRRELPDGRVEEVRWDALKKVEILSTAEGPLLEDVFFLLFAAGGGGAAVPSSLARETGLLPRLQRLPPLRRLRPEPAHGARHSMRLRCVAF